jgi:leucine-rich repeat-containing G protein-coupled receptor 6
MTVGWTFALTMAILPLFGISDYRKFAVCLPFETTTSALSLSYVIFLMLINGVAFLILMGCYLKMYCAIRGSQAWNSNDSRIAKRMALLVFTDFICWSPIAFFSLTAVFGLHLISLEQAKVLTVFVLPLNSCCNPFLYAIMTKQFKKDCVMICKTIEESRVTRGIGRCRHSSNFSNRQTPANTNSLIERSSREMPPLLPSQGCNCLAKSVEKEPRRSVIPPPETTFSKIWRRLFCNIPETPENRRRGHNDQYTYKIAEIQQKQHKRQGSVSSSENFSSSESKFHIQIEVMNVFQMIFFSPRFLAQSASLWNSVAATGSKTPKHLAHY